MSQSIRSNAFDKSRLMIIHTARRLEDALRHMPKVSCPLPQLALLVASAARRGSAAGPSSATNERLRILLSDEEDGQLLHGPGLRLAALNFPCPSSKASASATL